MAIDAIRNILKNELTSLENQTRQVKKALATLETGSIELTEGIIKIPTEGRKLSPGGREKIRQAMIKRWAKRKASPSSKGK